MKKCFLPILVVIFSGLVLAGDPPPAGDSPVAVIMKTVKNVTLKKSSGDWGMAKVGIPLATNDEIKTGEKSLALVKFTDNSILRIRENSALKIYADKNKGDLSKNTYLDKGKVGFNVSKQENEEFKFTTPTMVASIRGTEGFLAVGDDGNSLLVCTEGSIDVTATQGLKESGTVNGGNYAVIGNDGNVQGGQITPQMQNDNENLRKQTIKRLIIQTDEGELIIEYLGDE